METGEAAIATSDTASIPNNGREKSLQSIPRDHHITRVNVRSRIDRTMTSMIEAAEDRVEAAADGDARSAYAALRDRLAVQRTRAVDRWSRP
jgi:hypothetical protein